MTGVPIYGDIDGITTMRRQDLKSGDRGYLEQLPELHERSGRTLLPKED